MNLQIQHYLIKEVQSCDLRELWEEQGASFVLDALLDLHREETPTSWSEYPKGDYDEIHREGCYVCTCSQNYFRLYLIEVSVK